MLTVLYCSANIHYMLVDLIALIAVILGFAFGGVLGGIIVIILVAIIAMHN